MSNLWKIYYFIIMTHCTSMCTVMNQRKGKVHGMLETTVSFTGRSLLALFKQQNWRQNLQRFNDCDEWANSIHWWRPCDASAKSVESLEKDTAMCWQYLVHNHYIFREFVNAAQWKYSCYSWMSGSTFVWFMMLHSSKFTHCPPSNFDLCSFNLN